MHYVKRFLTTLFHTALALVLIFGEWGWGPLARAMDHLARLPVWSQLEVLIRRLPPYAALLLLCVPMLTLLPVKLLAVYWMARGHTVLGLLVVLAAKVVGTAVAARLFQLTQPALMQLAWFRHWYPRWLVWKDGVIAQVKNARPWRLAQAIARRARRTARKFMRFLGL
ncbi:hypothetical protein [Rhodoferax sp.]|uniref:hypothetical protein n=1 Tax=Rhodoferax sp. TaxID=50421 RepID=UPI0025F0C67B|nr:hypothetical protein [Rhodoferax sp.]